MLKKLKLISLLSLVLLAGGFRQADWLKFKSTEENFTISLPREPKQEWTRVRGPLGNGHHIYKIENNDITYTVSNSVFEKAVTEPKDIKRTLDFARDLLLTLSTGKLLSHEDLSLDGFSGRQVRVEKGKRVWTLRAYVVKERMYQLMTTELKGKEQTPEVAKFFESFKLLTPPL